MSKENPMTLKNGILGGQIINPKQATKVGRNLDFSGVENIQLAFDSWKATEFDIYLPDVNDAQNAFGDSQAVTINIDAPKLTEIWSALYRAHNLTTFTGNFPLAGDFAPWFCENLETVHIDMPNISSLKGIGTYNSKLTSFWVGEQGMANFSTLSDDNSFKNCELDEESTLYILNTLPTYSSGTHTIHIGKNTNWAYSQYVIDLLGDTEAGTKSYKGWTVTVQQGSPADPIQIRIDNLMEETLEEAGQPGYDVNANIAEWRALGVDAYDYDSEKYAYAKDTSWASTSFQAGAVVDDCLISMGNFAYGQKITVASGVTSIVWNADLPSLKTHDYYEGILPSTLTSLEWNGKMPNLVDGHSLFYNCKGLSSFNVELPPTLTNTSQMFYGCSGLSEWTGELPSSITNTSSMFHGCTGLTEWNVELPASITTISNMFSGCTGLTEWSVELPPNITSTRQMFQGCTGLTEWNVELPANITDAYQMFYNCSGLTSFNVELPATITLISQMFKGCSSLTSWTVDLPPNLTSTSSMFQQCRSLTSWTGELPANLTNTSDMFNGCYGLTSWTVQLPDSISDTYAMFQDCTALTSFQSDMPQSLSSATHMFSYCKLDETSVLRILNTLPTYTSGTHEINIGKNTKWASSTAIAALLGSTSAGTKSFKGWTVTVQS